MSVKLLTEHHFEFLSLKGGCKGSSESTLVKIPHCWKSHVTAQMFDVFSDGYKIITIASHVLVNISRWKIKFFFLSIFR